MGSQIVGIVQGIMYGGDTERIWFRCTEAGADVTAIKTSEKVHLTIYNPSGDVVLASTNMTQSGSTAWWYYDLDASATTTWEVGYGYRAQLDWINSSSIDQRRNMWLDVVADPFNDPLISSTQFDEEHPSWAAARHSSWTDWTRPILIAHTELARDLRSLKDSAGNPVYASRVLDRAVLERVEMAYAERAAIMHGMRADETMRKEYAARAVAAFQNLSEMYLDNDDDLVADEDEATMVGTTFTH